MPDTFIEVKKGDGVYLNGDMVPNLADFQQQATEVLHSPFFGLLVADAKTRAYKDGFLDSKSWDVTLGAKGWYGCAVNMEKLLKEIISFREPMV